jgi:hypothetical protein
MAAAVQGEMSKEEMSSVDSADFIGTPTSIVEASFGTPPKIHRKEKWERLSPLRCASLAS